VLVRHGDVGSSGGVQRGRKLRGVLVRRHRYHPGERGSSGPVVAAISWLIPASAAADMSTASGAILNSPAIFLPSHFLTTLRGRIPLAPVSDKLCNNSTEASDSKLGSARCRLNPLPTEIKLVTADTRGACLGIPNTVCGCPVEGGYCRAVPRRCSPKRITHPRRLRCFPDESFELEVIARPSIDVCGGHPPRPNRAAPRRSQKPREAPFGTQHRACHRRRAAAGHRDRGVPRRRNGNEVCIVHADADGNEGGDAARQGCFRQVARISAAGLTHWKARCT